MTEVVKVQRPMMTNGQGVPKWLIYDRAKKHMTQVPEIIIPAHVKAAMGGDFKAYFNGAWSSSVGWGLSNRVKAEDW